MRHLAVLWALGVLLAAAGSASATSWGPLPDGYEGFWYLGGEPEAYNSWKTTIGYAAAAGAQNSITQFQFRIMPVESTQKFWDTGFTAGDDMFYNVSGHPAVQGWSKLGVNNRYFWIGGAEILDPPGTVIIKIPFATGTWGGSPTNIPSFVLQGQSYHYEELRVSQEWWWDPSGDSGKGTWRASGYLGFPSVEPWGQTSPIPEPLTMLGMFLGLGSVGAYIRRRRSA